MGKQVIVVLDVDALNEEMIDHKELGKQVRRMFASVNSGNDTLIFQFVGFCNVKNQNEKDLLVEKLQNAVKETKIVLVQNGVNLPREKPTQEEVILKTLELAQLRLQVYKQIG